MLLSTYYLLMESQVSREKIIRMLKDFNSMEKIDSINLELFSSNINYEKWAWPCDNRGYNFCKDDRITLRRNTHGLFFCDIQAEAFFNANDISLVLYRTLVDLATLGYIKLNEKHLDIIERIAVAAIYDWFFAKNGNFCEKKNITRSIFAYDIFFKYYFNYFARIGQVDFCFDFDDSELTRRTENCPGVTFPNTTYSKKHSRGNGRLVCRSNLKCYSRAEKIKEKMKFLRLPKIPCPNRLEVSLTQRNCQYLTIENFKGDFETVARNFQAPIAKILKNELEQVVTFLEPKYKRPVFDEIFNLMKKEHISNELLPEFSSSTYRNKSMTFDEIYLLMTVLHLKG